MISYTHSDFEKDENIFFDYITKIKPTKIIVNHIKTNNSTIKVDIELIQSDLNQLSKKVKVEYSFNEFHHGLVYLELH